MKRKFKHRKFHYLDALDAFNRLLNSLVKGGFKIECCDLTEYKSMITKTKEEIYKQIIKEFNTRIILENFTYKINEEAVKDVFEKDLLKVPNI